MWLEVYLKLITYLLTEWTWYDKPSSNLRVSTFCKLDIIHCIIRCIASSRVWPCVFVEYTCFKSHVNNVYEPTQIRLLFQ